MRKLLGTLVLAAVVGGAASIGACSGGDSGSGLPPSPTGEAPASSPSPTESTAATATPASFATATPTATPEPATATPARQIGTPTSRPYDDSLPEPGSEEFLSTLEPGALLGRAMYEMSFVTSAHVTIDTQLSGPGTVITTIADYRLDGDTIYVTQKTLGITVELLQRGDGLCVKEAGGDWKASDLGSGLPLGDPRTFFDGLLNGKFENLVLVPDATLDNGERAYVLEGELAMDESGNIALVAEPAAAWATVQIALEWSTARILSYHLDTEATFEGTELDLTVDMTIDHHNLPAEFPGDLPATCSTLTS